MSIKKSQLKEDISFSTESIRFKEKLFNDVVVLDFRLWLLNAQKQNFWGKENVFLIKEEPYCKEESHSLRFNKKINELPQIFREFRKSLLQTGSNTFDYIVYSHIKFDISISFNEECADEDGLVYLIISCASNKNIDCWPVEVKYCEIHGIPIKEIDS